MPKKTIRENKYVSQYESIAWCIELNRGVTDEVINVLHVALMEEVAWPGSQLLALAEKQNKSTTEYIRI